MTRCVRLHDHVFLEQRRAVGEFSANRGTNCYSFFPFEAGGRLKIAAQGTSQARVGPSFSVKAKVVSRLSRHPPRPSSKARSTGLPQGTGATAAPPDDGATASQTPALSPPHSPPVATATPLPKEAHQGGQEEAAVPGWLRVLPHVVTAAFANVCFGYHIGILNGPLDQIAGDLGFSGNSLLEGVVVSTFLVGAFLGAFSGGPLSDRIGRTRTFQICSLPLILGTALSASAPSIEFMVLGRLLVGIGIGANASLVPLYISEVAPTRYRGALGSLGQIGTCLGIIAVLLFGIPSSSTDGWWRLMFWGGCLPGVLILAGMQFTAESPRWLAKVGRWQEAEEVARSLWGPVEAVLAMAELRAATEGQGQGQGQGQEEEEEEVSWGELLSHKYFKVVSMGAFLFIFQQFAGINGVLYFSSSTFKQAGIGSDMLASAAVAGSNLVGALAALYLIDRAGRRKCLMGSYAGMAISMGLLVAALGVPSIRDSSGPTLAVAATLAYVFMFALGAGPVTAMLLPEIFNTRIRAKAMSLSLCVHWVCNYFIGLLFLPAVEMVGVATIYSLFGAVSLGTVAYTYAAIPETKGRSLEEIEKDLYTDTKSA